MDNPEPVFRSDMVVEAVDQMGGDRSIIRAMLVSTAKDDAAYQMTDAAVTGRINALMRERHGTPFEHSAITFYVEAPIFVFREWHRHRIGVSINEMSGRYSELPPQFYMPPPDRPLVKVEGTKQIDYVSEAGTPEQRLFMESHVKHACREAYMAYQRMLGHGIVKEVARIVLPVGLYSKMYWTCNPRSLMAFLSLRQRMEAMMVQDEEAANVYYRQEGGAMFPSKPQHEINVAADLCEQVLAAHWPITHAAYVKHGRVAP